MSTRRSSRVVSVDAPTSATALASRRHHADSVVSAILREHERRKSRESSATTSGVIEIEPLLPVTSSSIGAIDLPGIHISRIETVEIDDDAGRRSASSRGSTRRYIIIESDFSSGDYSQLSFTSEHSLTGNGSRSSRSRSSRESSNVSSRLWDFSPRESEWDADVSHGSRDSQLGQSAVIKVDWGGGPSYGGCGLPAAIRDDYYESKGRGRDYSLLSPWNVRKNSPVVVTFDIGGEPAVRRHSSPTPQSSPSASGQSGTVKRCPRVSVDATAEDGDSRPSADANYRRTPTIGSSSAIRHIREVLIPKTAVTGTSLSGTALGSAGGTGIEEYRNWLPSAMHFRKRGSVAGGSATGGDPSVISIRIDENDGDEEEQQKGDEQHARTGQGVSTEDDTSTPISSTGTNPTTDSSTVYHPCRQIQAFTPAPGAACMSVTSGGGGGVEMGCRRPSRTDSGFDRLTQPPRPQQQWRSFQMKEGGTDGIGSDIGSSVQSGGRRGPALSAWRHHTDDSDVERRVARLFYEIEYSATDASLDTADTGTSFNGKPEARGPRCSRRTALCDISAESEGPCSVHGSRMYRPADGTADVRRTSAAAAGIGPNFEPQLAIGDSPQASRKAYGTASTSVSVVYDTSGGSSGSPVCGIVSLTSSSGGGAFGTTSCPSATTTTTDSNRRRQSTIATQTGIVEETGGLSNTTSISSSGANRTPSSSSTSSTTGSRKFQFLRRPFFPSSFMGRSLATSRALTDPPVAAGEVRSNLRPFEVLAGDGHRARRLLANLGLS